MIRGLCQFKSPLSIVTGDAGFLEPDFYKALRCDSDGIFIEAPALASGLYDTVHRAKYGTVLSQSGFEHAMITEIIAAALENPDRDPRLLGKALHAMTFDTGNAKLMAGVGVRFDERGGNAMAHSVMAKWCRSGRKTLSRNLSLGPASPLKNRSSQS
jgi:hypothetical protein